MMREANQQEPMQSDDVTLKSIILAIGEYLRLLRRNCWIIVCSSVLGAALLLLYSLYGPVRYKAQLFFVVDEDKGSTGLAGASGILSQLGFTLGSLTNSGGFFEGDNIMEFLKSRSMIDKTMLTSVSVNGKTDLLANHYVQVNGLREEWKDNERLSSFAFRDTAGMFLQDSLLAEFYRNIKKKNLAVKKKDKRLSIIEVNFEHSDEAFAKVFVETLIQNASDFYVRTKTLRSKENLEVLTHQVDSVRKALNAAIHGVAAATDANPDPNRAFQTLRVGSQLRTVDVQANTEILKELVKNQELARITLRNERPIIQILDKPILPLENNKLTKTLAIIIGGFLGGFLVCLVLLIRRIYRQIMEADPA